MKIFDNRNPHGRKVDRGDEHRVCPTCQGREGRHVLVSLPQEVTNKNGDRTIRKRTVPCPKG